MRITSAQAKVSYVTGAVVVFFLAGLLVAFLPHSSRVWISSAAAIAEVLFVAIGVRVFRGEGESVNAARPWWRMSAKPAASFVMAVIFLLQGARFLWSWDEAYPVVVVSIVIAVAYCYSGARLSRKMQLA